jgi:molybdenum cofactor cytidylyltransferase
MGRPLTLAQALRLAPGEVVAFTGGGGKTSAMFRLAAELAPHNRVLTTTSTRIFAAQIKQSPAHVIFDPVRQQLVDILPDLEWALTQHGQVLLVGPVDAASGKAFGIEPQFIDELAQSGRFDAILVEANGSRMRPFKAPAAHEPVIPASTSLVVPVVGLDIVGQPLTDEAVHRAALVSQLSGLPLNAPITGQTVAGVLAHPAGGAKGAPPNARIVPLLNKAETPAARAVARQIADILLRQPRIDAVVIGSMWQQAAPIEEVRGQMAAIILAAGGSSRYGSPKQLACWQDTTFIERAADVALAAPVGPVVVVLGAHAAECRAALGRRPVTVVDNPHWAEGQSSSIRVGLAALPPQVSAAIFLLVDQPGLTPEVITALIERHRHTLAPVIWPEYEGRRGNPVLFDRALFGQLSAITGDVGGRPVLRAHQARGEGVPVSNRHILIDIDRPEDLPEERVS